MTNRAPQSASTAPHVKTADDRDDEPIHDIGYLQTLVAPAMPIWKRCMDIMGALVGLGLLWPLFVMVAILIKTTSRGPVFFRQQRVGYLGRNFTMWKFRTMVVDADTDVHRRYVNDLVQNGNQLQKLDRDEHLIPFGKWLRKLCIDEIPQLINVLCGSMSLVGPRPDVVAMDEYPLWQQRRFDVFPGMTGLWQVSGKNSTTHERMVQLDIAYASQLSLLMDIKILFKTLPVILGQMRDQSTVNSQSLIRTQHEAQP